MIEDDALRQMSSVLYTREAGGSVTLEREILPKYARKTVTAKLLREQGIPSCHCDSADNLDDYLGVSRYRFRFGEMEDADQVGVVTTGSGMDRGGRRVAEY